MISTQTMFGSIYHKNLPAYLNFGDTVFISRPFFFSIEVMKCSEGREID